MTHVHLSTDRWGLLWQSRNRLDGETKHLVFRNRLPLLFTTRHEARTYADEHYGYIRNSPDLRREPHGWRVPATVRVTISAQPSSPFTLEIDDGE